MLIATLCSCLLARVSHAGEGDASSSGSPELQGRIDETTDRRLWTDDRDQVAVGYRYGFYLQTLDERFRLQLNGLFKLRYHYTNQVVAPARRGFVSRVSNPASAILFFGHLFTKRLTYMMMPDFGNGEFKVYYMYFVYEAVPKKLYFRVGQGKKPYARFFLTSPIERAFVLDATAYNYAKTGLPIGHGVDIGAEIGNNFVVAKGLEWTLGVYNGTSAMPIVTGVVHPHQPDASGELIPVTEAPLEEVTVTNYPAKMKPTLIGRFGYNWGGLKGYYASDQDGGPPRGGIAASIQADFDGDGDQRSFLRWEADGIFKAYHLTLSGGINFVYSAEGHFYESPELMGYAMHGQAGYAIKGWVEPVFRYSYVNPPGADNAISEFAGGLGLFFFKSQFKWDNNFGIDWYRYQRSMDYTYVSQFQVYF